MSTITEVRNGIGVSVRRPDGIPKVKGEFAYSSDMWADGMLWGATLRSPHPRARIHGIEIAAALTCAESLELGTLHGARCLGREDELGTLEPGKLADIVLWPLDDLDHAGIEDPVAALVLGARPLPATVIVDGRIVIAGGELRTGDPEQIARELSEVALR